MENILKLGSLFDGSGGFPLAGSMCNITPVWASEVEPYPIAVTKSRFPNMKHLGSVTDIKGDEIEPVDIITFGSPCQDLSVAGKRAGLKHEANGDSETTRSGLFMEAVRIIKEMRKKTHGVYPRIAIWENVPGAFSSNKGEDFRIVLEELVKIAEQDAVMPEVPKSGWAYADSYIGNGWSLAYRVLDAQYWGTPQRRRRIYLVLDLTDERAGEILFKREGLRRNFTESGTKRESAAGNAEDGSGMAIAEKTIEKSDIGIIDSIGGQAERIWYGNVSPCLKATHYKQPPCVCLPIGCFEGDGKSYGEIAPTLVGDHNNRVSDYSVLIAEPVVYNGENITSPTNAANPQPGDPCHTLGTDSRNYLVYCIQGNCIDRANTAGCNGKGWTEDVCYTLNTVDRPAIACDIEFFNSYKEISPTLLARMYKDPHIIGCMKQHNYIVRRITPTECARLQGFPDNWGHPVLKTDLTDGEYKFWLNVRNTHAKINGKTCKEYSKKQMLKWYSKLHNDSSEYKMWGNGIALPCALYVMQGIQEVLQGGNVNDV